MGPGDQRAVDTLLECLAAHRRRLVLARVLNSGEEQMSFDALVDFVVEEEAHSPPPDRDVVAVALHHRHLPKLADAGLIDYDSDQRSVTTTDETKRVEPYLAVIRRWTNSVNTEENDIG